MAQKPAPRIKIVRIIVSHKNCVYYYYYSGLPPLSWRRTHWGRQKMHLWYFRGGLYGDMEDWARCRGAEIKSLWFGVCFIWTRQFICLLLHMVQSAGQNPIWAVLYRGACAFTWDIYTPCSSAPFPLFLLCLLILIGENRGTHPTVFAIINIA